MSQAQAAAAVDRLPWLTDEPTRAPTRTRGNNFQPLGWALVVMLLVAAASYWMGAHSWKQSVSSENVQPGTTVPVPQPRTAPESEQPQVIFEPAPQVSPAPAREVPFVRPRVERRHGLRRTGPQLKRESPSTAEIDDIVASQKGVPAPAKPQAKAPANPDSKPLKAWPASQSQGAEGRIVRIGAFGSRQQAKLGWRHMVSAYPAVAHLKATVVSDRNSRGRYFYRFQIGTTSQAHSEVLCQRMEHIRFSCAVVGLPWKPKGVER
jgi:hypothetical protein